MLPTYLTRFRIFVPLPMFVIFPLNSCAIRSCRLMRVRTTLDGKILQRRGKHNHEATPALIQVRKNTASKINHKIMSALIQVKKLEAKKLEEVLRNPKTATAKNLLASISKEILNPEMAAFASSYQTIAVKLRRRLKKMKEVSSEFGQWEEKRQMWLFFWNFFGIHKIEIAI